MGGIMLETSRSRSRSIRNGARHVWSRFVSALCVVATVAISGAMFIASPASAAPGPISVSLTFDDGGVSQYTLGYLDALQPHGAHATFFVNSGTPGTGAFMSWAQLQQLQAAGNAIGGKSVNALDLTTLDPASARHQVCDDRQTLLSNGLTPIAFAYPSGVTNAAV